MLKEEKAKIELFDIIYQVYKMKEEEDSCNEGSITDNEFLFFIEKIFSLYKGHYENEKC